MDYDWSSPEAIIRIIKEKVLLSLSDTQPYQMADLFIICNIGLNFKRDFLNLYNFYDKSKLGSTKSQCQKQKKNKQTKPKNRPLICKL